jgi:hypothetical protein
MGLGSGQRGLSGWRRLHGRQNLTARNHFLELLRQAVIDSPDNLT